MVKLRSSEATFKLQLITTLLCAIRAYSIRKKHYYSSKLSIANGISYKGRVLNRRLKSDRRFATMGERGRFVSKFRANGYKAAYQDPAKTKHLHYDVRVATLLDGPLKDGTQLDRTALYRVQPVV